MKPKGDPSRSFVSAIAGGFEKACPNTYSDKILKEGKNARGYDEFVAVLSCGAAPVGLQLHPVHHVLRFTRKEGGDVGGGGHHEPAPGG